MDLRYVALRHGVAGPDRGISQRIGGSEARSVAQHHAGSCLPRLSSTSTAPTDTGPFLVPQAKTRAVELTGTSARQLLRTCICVQPSAASSRDGGRSHVREVATVVNGI
jgi:hypothetical protein